MIKTWIEAGLPTVSQRQQNVNPVLPGDQRHEPHEVADAIDKHVNQFLASAKLQPVPPGEDAEFLRRIYLDLTGRVPTAGQAISTTSASAQKSLSRSSPHRSCTSSGFGGRCRSTVITRIPNAATILRTGDRCPSVRPHGQCGR